MSDCNLKNVLPFGIANEPTIEEYLLQAAPDPEPFSFVPMLSTQEEILVKHKQERENIYPDNSFFDIYQHGMSVQLGSEKIVALKSYTNVDSSIGTFQKVAVQVSRNEQIIYSIPAGDGSPITTIRGLWAYSNHWVLEIAYVTENISLKNEISIESYGMIVQDAEILNNRYNYEEAFGFQLMNGKPFYFYKRDSQINISYDNREIQSRYDQIPHYQCCSGSQLNPKSAKNMVAFFAQRGGKRFYVEIGVYKK
jgi:hypothetical protein